MTTKSLPSYERTDDAALARVWLAEFIRKGLCGLCGNSGRITTKYGVENAPCICPNGRGVRTFMDAKDRKKWNEQIEKGCI